MKKFIVPAIVFVVMVAAGAFGAVKLRPIVAPTRADSTRADSSHAPTDSTTLSAIDSTTHAPVQADSLVSPASAPKHDAPAPVEKPAAAVAPATKTGPDSAERARWSSALAKMPAANAAKLLATMTEEEVASALAGVPDRQLAAILAALPAERAASALRRAMSPINAARKP